MRRVHDMPFGAQVTDGGTRFRLWAPDAQAVELLVDDRTIPLVPDAAGWCEALVPEAGHGSRYQYRIDGDLAVPDPCSRYQPDDVHGASEVVDPAAYAWQDAGWTGRPWEETVLYELHIGTFSPDGDFRGVLDRLDYLAALGVTAVELMPVADFPGRWNWGYDGACLFAPDSAYGRPEDLKALVDAAHARGLMVFLDVVYNHFGPEGNYLHVYAKKFFNFERETPWGAAIDFDGAESGPVVRDFFVHNALYWLQEFHIDGLRFDAVHAIRDDSDPHILSELAERVRAALPAERHVHLVLENDANQARYLERNAAGRPRQYVAQWNDDIHHALHVTLTAEDEGYYADYADDPIGHLARCLAEGFAYQGDTSPFRGNLPRGEPSAHLPPTAFVGFLQNHDQTGNRAFGERIGALAPLEAIQAATSLVLLAPSPPLLFMGEEWGASTPFLYFCDLGEDLHEAVRDGRRREFRSFSRFRSEQARAAIPDPMEERTHALSMLAWEEADTDPHAGMLAFTRRLLALRHDRLLALLQTGAGPGRAERTGRRGLRVTWPLAGGQASLTVAANLAPRPADTAIPEPDGERLQVTGEVTATGDGLRLGAWSTVHYLEA